MGNRAVIVGKGSEVGLYLQWNGGYDSVSAFLEYARRLHPGSGLGAREHQEFDSGLIPLMTIIANYFDGGGSSIYLQKVNPDNLEDVSPFDNGVYVVDGWDIVDRVDAPRTEQKNYDMKDMLREIEQAQPSALQVGIHEFQWRSPNELKVGDVILDNKIGGGFERRVVVGIGEDKMINGHKVLGVPYHDGYHVDNVNAYIFRDVLVQDHKEDEAAKEENN